jgi:large subunit ribosomal protein L6
MSRVGKKPIPIPDKVQVTLKGESVEVKGPKGDLNLVVPPRVSVSQEDGSIVVTPEGGERTDRMMQGLTRALIANMVHGVSVGFQKVLEIIGVGYRANVDGKNLVLELGYSHPIRYAIPEGIEIQVEKNTLVTVRGIDKQKVGDVAADIRGFRPPEPYKGKGVRYQNEYVRRKEGKKNA